MKKTLLIIALLTTGCVAHTHEQLLAMSDEQVCQAVQQDQLNRLYMEHMGARGLNCHPAQIQCKEMGHKVGTKAYERCLDSLVTQAFEQKAEQQRAAQAFQQIGKDFQAQQAARRPTQTFCQNTILGAQCQTY